jgi:hypothetical protein
MIFSEIDAQIVELGDHLDPNLQVQIVNLVRVGGVERALKEVFHKHQFFVELLNDKVCGAVPYMSIRYAFWFAFYELGAVW